MTEDAFNVLAPERRTVPAMLQRQAAVFGDRPLLSIAGMQWTHAQAAEAVARRACALRRAGVNRGDRVAIMCGNRVEFLETFLACGWIGAASVPINTASMGPQIQYFLANSGARLLVIEDQLIERLQTAELSQTQLEAIWVVGDLAAQAAGPGDVRCQSFPAQGEAVEPVDVQPGETLAILYTSGTTGPAKGVICPHAQYYWWGANTARILGLTAADVLCTTLPLFHINALNTFAQAALTGGKVVFAPRFSASGFWPSMQACEATVVYLLGAMVPILLAQ
ncbi:MAG TPA: AMP-binding protein, partial [Burkholderiaceae bacterium]